MTSTTTLLTKMLHKVISCHICIELYLAQVGFMRVVKRNWQQSVRSKKSHLPQSLGLVSFRLFEMNDAISVKQWNE